MFNDFLCQIYVYIRPIEVTRRLFFNIKNRFYWLIFKPGKIIVRHE